MDGFEVKQPTGMRRPSASNPSCSTSQSRIVARVTPSRCVRRRPPDASVSEVRSVTFRRGGRGGGSSVASAANLAPGGMRRRASCAATHVPWSVEDSRPMTPSQVPRCSSSTPTPTHGSCSTFLTQQGATVRVAADAAEARAALAAGAVHVVLMDPALPDGDGFALRASFRASPATRDLPVVALTGRADAKARTRALEAGFEKFISKPFDVFALPAALTSVLEAPAPPPDETDEQRLARLVADHNVRAILAELNADTPYRYTSVLRFDEGRLESVWTFDRQNGRVDAFPAETKVSESYCRYVADDGAPFATADALADSRTVRHAKRDAARLTRRAPFAPDGSVTASSATTTTSPGPCTPRRWRASAALRALSPFCRRARLTWRPPGARGCARSAGSSGSRSASAAAGAWLASSLTASRRPDGARRRRRARALPRIPSPGRPRRARRRRAPRPRRFLTRGDRLVPARSPSTSPSSSSSSALPRHGVRRPGDAATGCSTGARARPRSAGGARYAAARALEWTYDLARAGTFDRPRPARRRARSHTHAHATPTPRARPRRPAPTSTTGGRRPRPRRSPSAGGWPRARTLHPRPSGRGAGVGRSVSRSARGVARTRGARSRAPEGAPRLGADAWPTTRGLRAARDAALGRAHRHGARRGAWRYAEVMVAAGKAAGSTSSTSAATPHPLERSRRRTHAWNAARVGGTWWLVDATWDAGWVDGSRFEKHYGTGYFLTPPRSSASTTSRRTPRGSPARRASTAAILPPARAHAELRRRAPRAALPTRSQVTVSGPFEIVVENPARVSLLHEASGARGVRVDDAGTTRCAPCPPRAAPPSACCQPDARSRPRLRRPARGRPNRREAARGAMASWGTMGLPSPHSPDAHRQGRQRLVARAHAAGYGTSSRTRRTT